MMGIAASAGRLFELLASKDDSFTKYLRPGLTRKQIDAIIAPHQLVLPPEVLEFYENFDLLSGYAYNPDQPSFYGIYWLLGLEDLVATWLLRQSFDFIPEYERTWIPFLEEDGNGYLVDPVANGAGQNQVFHIFHGLDSELKFASLTAMFDTFHAWVSEGVLAIEQGHVAGDYEGDAVRVARIAARLNPGVESWQARLCVAEGWA